MTWQRQVCINFMHTCIGTVILYTCIYTLARDSLPPPPPPPHTHTYRISLLACIVARTDSIIAHVSRVPSTAQRTPQQHAPDIQ